MNKEDYQKYVEDKSPKSPIIIDCIKAFIVGGLICSIRSNNLLFCIVA